MNTEHNQTARPSRVRVMRARVGAWHDRHADTLAWCALSAFTVAFSVAFTYALVIDAPSAEWITENRALAFVGIAFAFTAFAFVVGGFVHLLTQDITARKHARVHARVLARVNSEWSRELVKSELAHEKTRTLLLAEIGNARREASRNAYALLTALEESDAH